MAPVNRPPGWIYHALWKHHASERCRVCIPDTLLISEGTPVRWLFTSRTGEVVRKRAIDIKSVRERFVKIGLLDSKNERRYTAMCRRKTDSSTKPQLLDAAELGPFMAREMASDPNLIAIQSYVHAKGGVGVVYRNEYTVTNDMGKVVTATYKITRFTEDGEEKVSEPIINKVTRLNKELDVNTRAIVRFIETQHRMKILKLTGEYIVDADHRVWFTWANNIVTTSGAEAVDLRLVEGLQGMPRTRKGEESAQDKARAEHEKRRRLRRAHRAQIANERERSPPRDAFDDQETVEMQLGDAMRLLEEEEHQDMFGKSSRSGQASTISSKHSRKKNDHFHVKAMTKRENRKWCPGDYCDFHIEEPDSLYGEEKKSGSGGGAEKLFSIAERSRLADRLGSSTALDDMLKHQHGHGRTGDSFSLTFKSIALARREKRGIQHQEGIDENDLLEIETGVSRKTNAQRFKEHEVKRRNMGLEGGAANFYKSCKVCSHCYVVYSTLDRARELLRMREDEARAAKAARLMASSNVPLLEDMSSQFDADVRAKAHAMGGDTENLKFGVHTNRRPQMAQKQHDPNDMINPNNPSNLLLPSVATVEMGGSIETSPVGITKKSSQAAEQERLARSQSMPWGGAESTALRNPKNKLRERRRQRALTKGNAKMDRFEGLEEYIRKDTKQEVKEESLAESSIDDEDVNNIWKEDTANVEDHGVVLLVDEEPPTRTHCLSVLENNFFEVDVATDGLRALEMVKERKYDAILASRALPGIDGIELTKLVRKMEADEEAALPPPKFGEKPRKVQRVPMIAFTDMASQEDLRLYMEVGMDGCVSKPLNEQALLATMAAAVPHHKGPTQRRSPQGLKHKGSSTGGGRHQPNYRAPQGGRGGDRLRASTTKLKMASSTSIVNKSLTLPVPMITAVTGGIFQMDADTAIPYTVIGKRHENSRLFNFVICQDLFDTCETMQIFFRPIISKYPGMQVLVWNYPGQAFSEWRKDVTLNNKYLAGCLDALLRHLGADGTAEFRTDGSPFYLVGFGNGGNIASYFGCHYASSGPFSMSLRAILLLNGFSYVGPHLAGVLHDCMNVFACSPANRPDLPVYFWTRFLFSASYLTRVSAPLALNLYTAVHNPITLEGRIQLCQGALANTDLRTPLRNLHYPLIAVHSAQNGLVKPSHIAAIVDSRGGEVRSLQKALKYRKKVCVIWMKAGHELFQECRKPLSNLMEQLATGFHETHDVSFFPQNAGPGSTIKTMNGGSTGQLNALVDQSILSGGISASMSGNIGGFGGGSMKSPSLNSGKKQGVRTAQAQGEMFEDKFIDNILGTLHDVRQENGASNNPFQPSVENVRNRAEDLQRQQQEQQWQDYQRKTQSNLAQASTGSLPRPTSGSTRRKKTSWDRDRHGLDAKSTLDPAHPSFERRSNRVYSEGSGSKIYPADFPEVKEYMRWRVQRNMKRLRKLTAAAECIQKAFRAFMARTMVQRMREERAALFVQRNWRGMMGRRRYWAKKKEEWAVRLLQRNWRGKQGRESFLQKKKERAAAISVQRVFRGRLAKRRVNSIRARREKSAIYVQKAFRAKMAREYAFRLREQRNAAIELQRVWRGCLGRRRAALERDKYLFSKAQSQGIEFGRQMLLEHKLHGTRLQSEVALLTREKVESEDQVEALLKEIAQFEEGVRQLEKEMHELSKVETEAKGVLDEDARVELREQKMRLDREFSIMLQKIADRKDQLTNLEAKLQTLDRHRQAKEEELRDLERKLVVLLEEQQKELEQIKQRQERRGERFISDDPNAGAIIAAGIGAAPGNGEGGGGGGGGGFKGPSPQQQQQAAALMQSTETLMKFGFMSMSLTYFSSLNMIRAMRATGALETLMAGKAMSGGPLALISEGGQPGAKMAGLGGANFKPGLRNGQLPGQEEEDPRAWSVEDVGEWLSSLALGQYRESFADAAVDGAFLMDLNDADLRNTLGIDHSLHRKKIINSIGRLRQQVQMDLIASGQATAGAAIAQPQMIPQQLPVGGGGGGVPPLALQPGAQGGGGGGGGTAADLAPLAQGEEDPGLALANLKLEELESWVRHGHYKKLKEALKNVPDRRFDPHMVDSQYLPDFGTQYTSDYERATFHMNKVDSHGNTLMLLAAQNGALKIAKLLLKKGANANHQNKQGQCALHYAMEYNYFDMGTWLADGENGAGADDTLENQFQLTPYDGLGV